MWKPFSVCVHNGFEYFAVGGRGPGNCVGARFNGLLYRFFGGTTGGHNGYIGEAFSYFSYNRRGFGSARYI